MTELATSDGLPLDLPRGEFFATKMPDGRIRINRADPRVLVTAELLAMVFTDAVQVPGVVLSAPPDNENGTPFWTGALLKINGVNQNVVYRIGEWVPAMRSYIAEWPD